MSQVSKRVEDYHKKIGIVMIKANVMVDREVIIAMFLNGLNKEIANVIEL